MVHARLGRLVAEQSLVLRRVERTPRPHHHRRRRPRPAPRGRSRRRRRRRRQRHPRGRELLEHQHQGTVGFTLDQQHVAARPAASVPSMTVSSVNLSQRVVAGTGYSVRGPGARRRSRSSSSWSRPGSTPAAAGRRSAATLGTTATASHWAFATGRTTTAADRAARRGQHVGTAALHRAARHTPGDPNSADQRTAKAVGAGSGPCSRSTPTASTPTRSSSSRPTGRSSPAGRCSAPAAR